MELSRLKQLVVEEFGSNLEGATPSKVRVFIARIQREVYPQLGARPFVVPDEPATSYQQVMRDFFMRVFELPPERAAAALWLLAFEMVFESMPEEPRHAGRVKG